MVLLSMMLVILVYLLFTVMSYKVESDMDGSSSYECGFDPISVARMIFSYRFFLISILFLIFDVEISLMLSVPFLLWGLWSYVIFVLFIVVLIGGLLYEYMYGSLDWV